MERLFFFLTYNWDVRVGFGLSGHIFVMSDLGVSFVFAMQYRLGPRADPDGV